MYVFAHKYRANLTLHTFLTRNLQRGPKMYLVKVVQLIHDCNLWEADILVTIKIYPHLINVRYAKHAHRRPSLTKLSPPEVSLSVYG